MISGVKVFVNTRCFERMTRTPVAHCVQCTLKTTCWMDATLRGTQTSRTLCYNTSPSTNTSNTSTAHTLTNKTHRRTQLICQRPYLRSLSSDNLSLSNLLGSSKVSGWNKAVTEAEKIVGYPTSFMSLRCLLSDEFSNVAMHMRKLVGTNHPLLKTARRFVFDGTDSLQMRGLLVLLVAKAAGPIPEALNSDSNLLEPMVSGIYPNQRNLAEITEMIHTAHLVHTGVVNMDRLVPADGSPQDIHFGNKLAVLCGDFLLANASIALARLYNTEVVELISSAIRDMMISEFPQPSAQLADSSQEGNTVTAWEKRTFLSTGSLLAKSCKGALMLARHSKEQQDAVFHLGTSMGCAYQLNEDLRSVLRPVSDMCVPSLLSLPMSLHLQNNPDHADLVSELQNAPSGKTQKKLLALLTESGTIKRVRGLVHTYQQEALKAVGVLGENEARTGITNMVRAVIEV